MIHSTASLACSHAASLGFSSCQFDDENFKLAHSQKYLLSMANAGRNTQGSQFFITTAVTSHLNGRHVVFGQVKTGKDVVDAIESVGSGNGRTSRHVVIADSGQL